ncbi:MAG: MucR family transcriptional regulator [Pseudomonadota bacterium]
MTELLNKSVLVEMTSKIVSSYLAFNPVPVTEIPRLIRMVGTQIASLENEATATEKVKPKPAVPIRRSVQDDYIVCLEDGKKLKLLKRYLRTRYDMSPEEYRERWKLPADYPMVAPNYAQLRSEMAHRIGLGRPKRRKGKARRRAAAA